MGPDLIHPQVYDRKVYSHMVLSGVGSVLVSLDFGKGLYIVVCDMVIVEEWMGRKNSREKGLGRAFIVRDF